MTAAPSRELVEARLDREREELAELLEDLGARARAGLDLRRRIRAHPIAWLLGATVLGVWLGRPR